MHKYLGMNLNYTKSGQMRVSIKKYVQNTINDFLEEIGSQAAATPASDYYLRLEMKREQGNAVSPIGGTVAFSL